MTDIDSAAKEFREALMLEGTVGVFGIPADDLFEVAERAFRRGFEAARKDDEHPELIIAFELNEDYPADYEFFLNEPAQWAELNDDKPFDWLDYIEWHLVCPRCGADDQIVEVDVSQRWNQLSEVKIDTDADAPEDQLAYVFASTGDGNYDHEHFLCMECHAKLSAPYYFSIADWS